jgi:HK97 family phage portal protein
MGWLRRLSQTFPFGRKGMTSEDIWRQLHGGRESRSGVSVNWQTAIEVATVLACVRVIANGISQVPFRLYQETDAGRAPAKDHPLYAVLTRRPNSWQTSYTLRETIAYHVVLTGNAFVWKGMVGSAREIRVLEPIEPRHVKVMRARDGTLTYEITADDGAAKLFGADEIWHVRGPSWNSWMGLDATRLARDAIGLSIATEAAHAEFHKGSARVSGLLSMKETFGKEKFELLSAWLDQHSEGGPRAGKPLIMDNAASWTPFGMSGVDAQHLETRKHQIEEICRALGVMPIMVGHADKSATYASAEQMFLAHVVHTLAPWYERLEQSANQNLLSTADQDAGFYTKFSPNALMRGAAKDRADFYTKALGAGGHGTAWMTPNEVRALEEMDPVEGGESLPAGSDKPAPAKEAQNGPD